MPSTWLNDVALENTLHEAFEEADREFSMWFESEVRSNEERLTGFFVKILCDKGRRAERILRSWGRDLTSSQWHFRMSYRDVTPLRGEKRYGADMAFILSVKVPGYMERRKAILVQAKKILVQVDGSNINYHSSWPIDLEQTVRLHSTTPFSYFFLYGPEFNRTMTRVIPAASVLGILKATGHESALPVSQALSSSRSLSDFLLFDFIGCWVGDESEEILRIADGEDAEFRIGRVICVEILAEKHGEE
jgi:hypothetical protein